MMHAVPFVAGDHPRGTAGRFAGKDHGNTPSLSQSPKMVMAVPRRSETRGESWQRTGAKIAELPIAYTGRRTMEMPMGSFIHYEWKPQIPKNGDPASHAQLVKSLVSVIQANKPGTLARAQEQKLIPDGTSFRTIKRAYHHAAMLGLHDFGVGTYNFKMDDDLKAEMTPLVPFMRYTRRRVKSMMLGTERGAWRPYRAEFGQKFPTPKYDKATGAERLRVPPNDVLVKAGPTAPLMPAQPKPGVLQAEPGLSRFARYRSLVARNESQGVHTLKPLSQAQRMQRVKAAKAWKMKVESGAPRLQAGQPGSIAGLGLKRQMG